MPFLISCMAANKFIIHNCYYIFVCIYQCNRTQAFEEFFSIVQDSKELSKLQAIIGADCSSVTLPISEISHYYDLTQVSRITIMVRWPRDLVIKMVITCFYLFCLVADIRTSHGYIKYYV